MYISGRIFVELFANTRHTILWQLRSEVGTPQNSTPDNKHYPNLSSQRERKKNYEWYKYFEHASIAFQVNNMCC